ncbi:Retrovirus-related Pol polyprotein from transposon TNT 1-94-like protein [Drosera capensis]
MDDELDFMKRNQVWELVDLPAGRSAIGNKWVFKIKRKPNKTIHKYKARLVAKGFTQQEGVDYDETYSSVACINFVCLVLLIVAHLYLELYHMDVKIAFLNVELEKEIYMAQSWGFEASGSQSNKVYHLWRSIYGLKQSSRQWYLCFHRAMLETKFLVVEEDHCVYVKRSKGSLLILSLYVDGILIVGNDKNSNVTTQKWLSSLFEMKDMDQAKPINTPCDKSAILFHDQCPHMDAERHKMSPIPYVSAVGNLMYVMVCTRPDICFPVSLVSRFQSDRGLKHWKAMKRILRYFRGTADYMLCFQGEEFRLRGYADADWATDPDERKSTSPYVFTLNGEAVSWSSKK